MAAYSFSNPCVYADLAFVAPLFGPGGAREVSEQRGDTFLAIAEARVARDIWGDAKAAWAVCLLAAHMLFEDLQANAVDPIAEDDSGVGYAGPVTSESVGPLSRSFGASSSSTRFTPGGAGAFDDEELATTPWGKRFVAMRKEVLGAHVAVGDI